MISEFTTAVIPWPLRPFIKAHGGGGYTETVDGRKTTTTENFLVLGHYVQRHLIAKCECSFCKPHSLETWKELDPPGRFQVEVPPPANPWDWTSISWRWGVWQYYVKFERRLVPARRPFYRAERWFS